MSELAKKDAAAVKIAAQEAISKADEESKSTGDSTTGTESTGVSFRIVISK